VPEHLRKGFSLAGDSTATFYPWKAGASAGSAGTPPMWVEPGAVFDEIPPKQADDFVRQMDAARFNVPGNDTDPATGLAHSEYQYNSITGKWHPHYVQEVRPNVFRDVYLEPNAPVPAEWPPDIKSPVQQALEDNPLWETEQWPEWTSQGKEMMLRNRRRWVEGQADDWKRYAEQNPEDHTEKMKNDAGYRKQYNSITEQATRGRGGWHNVGSGPMQSEPWSMTTSALPGFEQPPIQSATSTGNIRRLLGRMAPAVAVGVGAGSQQQSPVTKELLK
jgi:hypothetical protein